MEGKHLYKTTCTNLQENLHTPIGTPTQTYKQPLNKKANIVKTTKTHKQTTLVKPITKMKPH